MSIYRSGQEDPGDLTQDEYCVFYAYLYSMCLDFEEKYQLQQQAGARDHGDNDGHVRQFRRRGGRNGGTEVMTVCTSIPAGFHFERIAGGV